MARSFIIAVLVVATIQTILSQDVTEKKPAVPEETKEGPSKEDAAVYSYYSGYQFASRFGKSPQFKGKDSAAFLKGAKSVLLKEGGSAEDKATKDYAFGVSLGKQMATAMKKQVPFMGFKDFVAGMTDGFDGKPAAYKSEEVKKAAAACMKFVKQPKRKPMPPNAMLKKQAPAWEVGSWHQLPAGKTALDVSDFKGKVLYLYCFQSWCPGCHSHGFPTLKKLTEAYKGDDKVAFVCMQTVFEDRKSKPVNTFENLKKVAKKFKLDIPFAQSGSHEDKSKVMKAYKTRGTPWTIIIDPKGVIQFSDFRITVDQAKKIIDSLKE